MQLDRLKVSVIVDNQTDGLSPPCGCCDPSAAAADRAAKYTSEVSHLVSEVKGGSRECVDFSAICFAGHGYSLLLEAEAEGGKCHRLLFDGGPSQELWRHNAASLGIPVGDIEALVLSHWHIDHSVGLLAAAQEISKARGASQADPRSSKSNSGSGSGGAGTQPEQTQHQGAVAAAGVQHASGPVQQEAAGAEESNGQPPVIFDLHPRRPHRRGLQLDIIPFNCEPELPALQQPGIEVQLHDEPHTLLDDCFFVSGFIPRVTPYETGNPNHMSQWEAGGPWELDEEIADERYVAAAVKGRGLVVFSACSHAGIVNVMKDVEQRTGKPPYAVFGGFHLAPKDLLPRIEPTIKDIEQLQPSLVVGGHCTGWRAQTRLVEVLQDRFMPSLVGSTFSIPALQPDSCLGACV